VDNAGEILVCNVTAEKKIEVEKKLKIHESGLVSVFLEVDNDCFASGTISGSLVCWDLKGNIIKTI